MGNILENLNREFGVQLASISWTTTVSSTTLIAAPSSGKEIVLRYIVCSASGTGIPVRITTGTTADPGVYTMPAGGNLIEEALIRCGDAKGLSVHAAATIGNGCIRAYYTIGQTSGTTT